MHTMLRTALLLLMCGATAPHPTMAETPATREQLQPLIVGWFNRTPTRAEAEHGVLAILDALDARDIFQTREEYEAIAENEIKKFLDKGYQQGQAAPQHFAADGVWTTAHEPVARDGAFQQPPDEIGAWKLQRRGESWRLYLTDAAGQTSEYVVQSAGKYEFRLLPLVDGGEQIWPQRYVRMLQPPEWRSAND